MHMHSTYSDGVRTPAELIDMAKAKGLAGIALTDHDSMEGFAELSAAAVTAHVEVMTGVELSCEFNGKDLHVLGYGIDATHAPRQSSSARIDASVSFGVFPSSCSAVLISTVSP